MRQKLVLSDFGYAESFEGLIFEPYPQPPDRSSPNIALKNYHSRLNKMALEEPGILPLLENLEPGSPRLAILSDELREAGFLKMDSPWEEFFDTETPRIYRWNKSTLKIMKDWRDEQMVTMFPSGLVYN